MVNANLFSIKHPFTWHHRRLKTNFKMYVHMYVLVYIACTFDLNTYVSQMQNTRKIKAKATFYDLCVLRNFKSTEQYLSAK